MHYHLRKEGLLEAPYNHEALVEILQNFPDLSWQQCFPIFTEFTFTQEIFSPASP